MTYGSSWSEQFIEQIADPEDRREFVRDQVRTRLALLIRALREQDERGWSQTELGRRMEPPKPQSSVSRIEDPDYGKVSLETLFEVSEAFGLPLWIDFPEWGDWLRRIREVEACQLWRHSFDADAMKERARAARDGTAEGKIIHLTFNGSGIANIQSSGSVEFKAVGS
jgi:hypothetical protein